MLDKFALMKYNITYMASAVVADAIETKKKIPRYVGNMRIA